MLCYHAYPKYAFNAEEVCRVQCGHMASLACSLSNFLKPSCLEPKRSCASGQSSRPEVRVQIGRVWSLFRQAQIGDLRRRWRRVTYPK
eukprot:1567220-Amphidinium_carterae.1